MNHFLTPACRRFNIACVCITEKKEQPYWFNIKTNESRWNTPPSCAWQRVEVQGHPAKYVNAVTGQETYTVPAVSAWPCLWHSWIRSRT